MSVNCSSIIVRYIRIYSLIHRGKVTARIAVLTRIRIATGQCDDSVDFRKCRKITLVGIRRCGS